MADVDLNAGGWKQTFIDLFAGATGGVAQVLIGKSSSIISNFTETQGNEYFALSK